MAYTTIDDPSAHFQIALWTGNGSSGTAITNDGNSDLQPDWIWGKIRDDNADASRNHWLIDSTRGLNKALGANTTSSEETNSGYLNSFDSDGFTLGSDGNSNDNGDTVVGWQWKANGGTTASNTDGTITSTVQANTTAGFSIVTYTGNGTNGAYVGHGLSSAPNIVMIKNRSAGDAWRVGFSAFSNDLVLNDNSASAAYSAGRIGDLLSTKFELGGAGSFDSTNVNSENYVAYCFASIQGYSKIGSYTGNGNADGPFVYLGFKPAWVMVKHTTSTESWAIFDNKRVNTYNPQNGRIHADLANEESTDIFADFVSNGFKIRNTGADKNVSGAVYIYMAFAEHPFVSSKGVPTTAR